MIAVFRRGRYGRMRQAGCGGSDATTTHHDGGGAVGRNADDCFVDLFVALFVRNCSLVNFVRSCGPVYLFMDARVLRQR